MAASSRSSSPVVAACAAAAAAAAAQAALLQGVQGIWHPSATPPARCAAGIGSGRVWGGRCRVAGFKTLAAGSRGACAVAARR